MIPETIITMMIQFPSVAGLAFALYVLSSALSRILDTVERMVGCRPVNVDFSDERSGTSPEEKSELTGDETET